MYSIFQILGLIIAFIGGFAFLVAAFRTSVLWGLGCFLFAPVSIFYLFFHWPKAKKPFLIQIIGVAIIIASMFAGGEIQF